MKRDDRKAAIADYKKRSSVAGIYAVRCTASGETWVGQTPNVETVENRIWFTLRLGSNHCRGLQAAWHDRGPESFSFDVLERLADEESSYIRNALLKERLAYWRSELGAAVL